MLNALAFFDREMFQEELITGPLNKSYTDYSQERCVRKLFLAKLPAVR